MSTNDSVTQEFQDFLDKNFRNMPRGFFIDAQHKAEAAIANHGTIAFIPDSIHPKRWNITITVEGGNGEGDRDILPGQLIQNRPRIESNLARAIRKWLLESLPLDASAFGKVTVELN